MRKFFSRFWPFLFSVKTEPWTADDQVNMDAFVSSNLCISVEKSLRNRLADRNSSVLSDAGSQKAMVQKGKMDELADILLEWKNLREDLTKKNNAR